MKQPLIESFGIVKESIAVCDEYLKGIKINANNIKKSIKNDIIAADIVSELALKNNIPFREAYLKVGTKLKDIKDIDLRGEISRKKSLGSAGNLNLSYYKRLLTKI